MRRYAILATLALALAACGGGSATPLTASQLAHKIPGCTHFVTQTSSVLATGDVTCDAPGDGALGSVEIATFATMGDEQKWILRKGSDGCCVEGHLWVVAEFGPDEFPRIVHALGGRDVTG